MTTGKNNITIGFLTMVFFMLYGFLLIYLLDITPDKAQWVAEYTTRKYF